MTIDVDDTTPTPAPVQKTVVTSILLGGITVELMSDGTAAIVTIPVTTTLTLTAAQLTNLIAVAAMLQSNGVQQATAASIKALAAKDGD